MASLSTIRFREFQDLNCSYNVDCSKSFQNRQGKCNFFLHKWNMVDTPLFECVKFENISHIVEICTLTKFEGSIGRLYNADRHTIRYVAWKCAFWVRNMCYITLSKFYVITVFHLFNLVICSYVYPLFMILLIIPICLFQLLVY